MLVMSKKHRKQTNSILLRLIGVLSCIFVGATLSIVVYTMSVSDGSSHRAASLAIGLITMIIAIPLAVFFSIRAYGMVQEIGLAAVQNREPELDSVRIWQHVLLLAIIGIPAFIVAVMMRLMHFPELSFIFTLAEVTIFYLAPVAVVAKGSAVDGIEQSYRLFRTNPSYVILCGAVAALITYGVSYLPLAVTNSLHVSLASKALAAMASILGSFFLPFVLFWYEPFYRAQIYQSMIGPVEEQLISIETALN